jgi:hypothetical protein
VPAKGKAAREAAVGDSRLPASDSRQLLKGTTGQK